MIWLNAIFCLCKWFYFVFLKSFPSSKCINSNYWNCCKLSCDLSISRCKLMHFTVLTVCAVVLLFKSFPIRMVVLVHIYHSQTVCNLRHILCKLRKFLVNVFYHKIQKMHFLLLSSVKWLHSKHQNMDNDEQKAKETKEPPKKS